MRISHTLIQPRARQQGSVLIVGMVILVIMMVGAISMMNSAVQDERITGNTKASVEAFFAAEAGYLQALEYLEPAASDNPSKLDTQLAKKRWSDLEEHLKKFSTPTDWNQKSIEPAGLNPGSGKPSFTISIAPVFEPEIDSDGKVKLDASGKPKMKRAEHKIQFASNGTFGEATRAIGFNLDGSGLFSGGIPAPAAISCFGSGCNLKPGNASDAAISGRNHPVPENNCDGKGGSNCWEKPFSEGEEKMSVPAVFLSKRSESHLEGANGNKKNAYHGQDRNKADDEDTPYTTGNSTDADSVWAPSDYPDDTAPTYDSFFGNSEDAKLKNVLDAIKQSPLPDGIFTVDSSVDSSMPIDEKSLSGIMVIDGDGTNDIRVNSTGFFAGLIILRGCNSINTSGNFTVYGAIIVDGKDKNGKPCNCADQQCTTKSPYYPFVGGGTIDVKYSLDALNNAGYGNGGTGAGFGVTDDWYEIVSE